MEVKHGARHCTRHGARHETRHETDDGVGRIGIGAGKQNPSTSSVLTKSTRTMMLIVCSIVVDLNRVSNISVSEHPWS